jgi:hypothetical protein
VRVFFFAAALTLAATPAAAQNLTQMGSSLLKTCTSNWNALSALQKGKLDSQSFISACMAKQNPTAGVLGEGSGASVLTGALGAGALGTSPSGGSTSDLLNSVTGNSAAPASRGCADKWSALSTAEKARLDQRSFLAGCAAQ